MGVTVPQPENWLKSLLDNHRRLIAIYGWSVQGVLPADSHPDSVPFSYTVGLTEKFLPELVVAGLYEDSGYGAGALNQVAERLLNDDLAHYIPEVGDVFRVADAPHLNWKIGAVSQQWIKENVTVPRPLFPGRDIKALQVIWPDENGAYPDDPEWRRGNQQPLLAPDRCTPEIGEHSIPHRGCILR